MAKRKKNNKKGDVKLPPWWDEGAGDCWEISKGKMSVEEEIVRNIIKAIIPFAVIAGVLFAMGECESERRKALPKPEKADWDSGLDKSIPATQLIHYDIKTRTAIYGPPAEIPPPISREEYEANRKRYPEQEQGSEELSEQDLLDMFEEYYDGPVELWE